MRTRDRTHRAPVLAAFSPDTGAREAVEFGVAASRITGAPLVIVVVIDTGSLHGHFGAGEAPSLPASIASSVDHLEAELAERGVVAEVRAMEDSTAARGLARAIDECDPELLVIGSTSRGRTGALLLGTTAERVIHLSPCPVAVVPNGYRRPENGVAVIGAAFAAQEEAEHALRAAARLARSGRVALRVLTAVDPDDALQESQARAWVSEVAGDLEVEIEVVTGDPADVLVAASERVDLLVMGSRGLGTRRAVILGSVSRQVVDRAACPVLVIPRGTAAKRDDLVRDAEALAPRTPLSAGGLSRTRRSGRSAPR